MQINPNSEPPITDQPLAQPYIVGAAGQPAQPGMVQMTAQPGMMQ